MSAIHNNLPADTSSGWRAMCPYSWYLSPQAGGGGRGGFLTDLTALVLGDLTRHLLKLLALTARVNPRLCSAGFHAQSPM